MGRGRPRGSSGDAQCSRRRFAGVEPTYAPIIAHGPNASINPNTGEPVTKQVVYDILESRCYDIDPDIPVSRQERLAKNAVLLQDVPKRLVFGGHMLVLRRTPAWYWRHVVWTDICNSVFPTILRKASAQALAQKVDSGRILEYSSLKVYTDRAARCNFYGAVELC